MEESREIKHCCWCGGSLFLDDQRAWSQIDLLSGETHVIFCSHEHMDAFNAEFNPPLTVQVHGTKLMARA